MLTDDQARALLHRAADTIDVDTPLPLALPERRSFSRLGLVAAAAALVVVGAGAAVIAAHDPAPDQNAIASAPTDPFDTLWPAPGDPNYLQMAPNQMPSLFGYSADDAVALLKSHGLHVTVEHEDSCDATPDRVMSTEPELGSVIHAGQTITLTATSGDIPPTVSCAAGSGDYGIAWALLDWINGRGPAPTFADTVHETAGVFTGDVDRYFNADAAADLANWKGDFDDLRDESRRVYYPSGPTGYSNPLLLISDDSSSRGPVDDVKISLEQPYVDGIFPGQPSVTLTLESGAITEVHIGGALAEPGQPYSPRVEGNPYAFALQRLEKYGYTVEADPDAATDPLRIVTGEEIDPDTKVARLTFGGTP